MSSGLFDMFTTQVTRYVLCLLQDLNLTITVRIHSSRVTLTFSSRRVILTPFFHMDFIQHSSNV